MRFWLALLLLVAPVVTARAQAGAAAKLHPTDEDEAEEAVHQNPRAAETWYRLGEARRRRSLLQDKAKAAYENAIQLKPEYVDAYIGLAWSYEIFEGCGYLAWSMNPSDWERHYSKAIGLYNKVIELKPDSVEAYRALGRIYFRIHHYEQATWAFERTLGLDQGSFDILRDLGESYERLGF